LASVALSPFPSTLHIVLPPASITNQGYKRKPQQQEKLTRLEEEEEAAVTEKIGGESVFILFLPQLYIIHEAITSE
jgi:hypothetical protein